MPQKPGRDEMISARVNEAAHDSVVSQFDKFKRAARELGTDEDPERFKAIVQRLAKAPPVKNSDKPAKSSPKGQGVEAVSSAMKRD